MLLVQEFYRTCHAFIEERGVPALDKAESQGDPHV